MSDHLPECLTPDPASPEILCICDRLRACEQRVLSGPMSMPSYLDGRKRGYAAGLDAAQEAIRNREDGDYFPWVQVEIAVAAIEALKTK